MFEAIVQVEQEGTSAQLAMAGTSGRSQQLEGLKLSGEGDPAASGVRGGDGATTSASGGCAATASGSSVKEQIKRSKIHWSLLSDQSGCSQDGEVAEVSQDGEVAEVSNVEEFKALQSHPDWGYFFQTFGYHLGGRYGSMGEIVMGEKFAEGAQGEIYDAQVTWWYPKGNEQDKKAGRKYVLKVFKKGTFLKHIKSQMPHGLFKFYVEQIASWASPKPKPIARYWSDVRHGILLKDGRFAFLMEREDFDLRSLIERNIGKDCGPFSKEEAELIMYHIALGVEWLHSRDMIHRDLKASNVLVYVKNPEFKHKCSIADYECSVGVLGTGFFRAPEILQACKDRKLSERPNVFSKAADIYGYGMVWYEVLTGKLPFEGHRSNDYDLVLNGKHLELPEYVESWVSDIVNRCWQVDPKDRPRIGEILDLFLAKSKAVRRYEIDMARILGRSFTSRTDKKMSFFRLLFGL